MIKISERLEVKNVLKAEGQKCYVCFTEKTLSIKLLWVKFY